MPCDCSGYPDTRSQDLVKLKRRYVDLAEHHTKVELLLEAILMLHDTDEAYRENYDEICKEQIRIGPYWKWRLCK